MKKHFKMKNLIITLFVGFYLAGCAFIGQEQPAFMDIQSSYLIKQVITSQEKSNMSPTETPPPTIEKSTKTSISAENIFLPGIEVFAFGAREPGWYTVNDTVMGGISSSTVEITDAENLSFSGNMSLENNGGFSSARSEWYPIDLTSADGMLLRVLGDGKMYRLRIYSETTGNNIAYNAIFETTPEDWKLVYIPFAGMVPTYFGYIADVGKLDASNISSFGLMLSDKQPGEFDLQVDWMRAISEEDLPIMGIN